MCRSKIDSSLTEQERFFRHVDKTETCWLWTGYIAESGYGKVRFRNKIKRAHVVSWEFVNGPVSFELELDHVKDKGCVNKHCVNPDHLEAITHRDNVLRGNSPSATQHRLGKCKRGHEYNEKNTLYKKNGNVSMCRECYKYLRGIRRQISKANNIAGKIEQLENVSL